MRNDSLGKHFKPSFPVPDDLEWHSVREHPFQTFGIFYCKEEGKYHRIPKRIGDNTNQTVAWLASHTAGGRVRFITDSPYIALRCVQPYREPIPQMTMVATNGFTLAVNKKFCCTFTPSYRDFVAADPALNGSGEIVFDQICRPDTDAPYEATLYFPLYSDVNEVLIGLARGSELKAPPPYAHVKPILFYGSSITQGLCAGKPGDDYINRLSAWLDSDILNFGVAGSAQAEQTIVNYFAKLDASVFVLNYDYNAPDVEYLAKTHYPMYETVRKAHPETPIVFMTRPHFSYGRKNENAERYKVIENNFKRASVTDRNVYLVDCYGCFGMNGQNDSGTIDDIHPDSLGFFRMAKWLYPVLHPLLNG